MFALLNGHSKSHLLITSYHYHSYKYDILPLGDPQTLNNKFRAWSEFARINQIWRKVCGFLLHLLSWLYMCSFCLLEYFPHSTKNSHCKIKIWAMAHCKWKPLHGFLTDLGNTGTSLWPEGPFYLSHETFNTTITLSVLLTLHILWLLSSTKRTLLYRVRKYSTMYLK